jgi:protein-S-isoprenylcysteine O-methyltransferase
MKFPIPMMMALAYGVSEAGLRVFKRSRDDSVDADSSTLRILWITIGLSMTAGIFASRLVPAMAIESIAVYWLGCALFFLGVVLRWYAILYLGRYFTVNVAIHSRHEVIDTGPYRQIRHPSYSGSLLAFLGVALSFRNWLTIALIMVPVIWAFAWRMATEEAALANALGKPYTNYMSRTKRLAPYIY